MQKVNEGSDSGNGLQWRLYRQVIGDQNGHQDDQPVQSTSYSTFFAVLGDVAISTFIKTIAASTLLLF